MEVNGTRFTEKAEAGEAILAVCKANQSLAADYFSRLLFFPFQTKKPALA